MKKILIIGASGGTGKYLVEYFLEKKQDEIQLIATGRSQYSLWDDRVEYISLDICNCNEFEKLPRDVYAVILLAGAMPARMEGYNPDIYVQTNIVGTLNVLNYCVATHVDRILYTQSFGDIKDWAEKEVILGPDLYPNYKYNTDHSVYVISKNAAVDLIRCYHEINGIKAFIFRLPTIYSWSENDSYYVDGVLKKRAWRILIDKAISGENIEVWGDGNRQKDMVYVKDFCQMLYLATFVNREYGHYNVGTGIGVTLIDQIKGIIRVFGDENKSKIILCPEKANAPQYIMDISNAQEELGYIPQFDYISMLNDMKKIMLDRSNI